MTFYIPISYAVWVSTGRASQINIHVSNVLYWYWNISAKTTSSHILSFEHSRRLSSTVSNLANNKKFGRMMWWFWQYMFHMQYMQVRVEIAISIREFPTWSIDYGIDQRILHHRASCRLDTAGDWIQQYQIIYTIENSAECCYYFGSIYFICNMSMKESRYPINTRITNMVNL